MRSNPLGHLHERRSPVGQIDDDVDRALISRKNGRTPPAFVGPSINRIAACKCTMAAPACAAPTAASAISLAVTGRLGEHRRRMD